PAEADVEVRAAVARPAAEAADEEVALIRRDRGLEAPDARVVQVGQLLGGLIPAIDQPRPVEVVAGPLAAGREVEVAVRGDRAEDLVEAVVDGSLENPRLVPADAVSASVRFPRRLPDVEVMTVDAVHRPVRRPQHRAP